MIRCILAISVTCSKEETTTRALNTTVLVSVETTWGAELELDFFKLNGFFLAMRAVVTKCIKYISTVKKKCSSNSKNFSFVREGPNIHGGDQKGRGGVEREKEKVEGKGGDA